MKKPSQSALGALSTKEHNRAPLYHQIFLILKSKINDGEFLAGSYIPGEREISETFKVSRITAIKALNELAESGLVVRERGRGTRVQFTGSGIVTRGPAERGTELDDGPAAGRQPSRITIYRFEYVPAPPEVAAALALVEGEEVQCTVRVSNFEEHPVNHLTAYVPAEIGRKWSEDDLLTTSMQKLLLRSGIRVERIDEHVTATLADVILAERLKVSIGGPLLKITRAVFDDGGRPLIHQIGSYPPDRFRYSVTLYQGVASRLA